MLAYVKASIKHILLKRKFSNSVFYSDVRVDGISHISKDCVLYGGVCISDSTIGDRSYIQKNSTIHSTSVGNYCSIASNVTIGLANHPINMVSTSPVFYDSSQPLPFFFTDQKLTENILPRTIIESDVWIGQGVMIKAGVCVGVGAVLGAGAVVVKDVAPYSIVCGCPAKHIRWRFDEKIRSGLIDSKWWALDDGALARLAQSFIDPKEMLVNYDRNN